jgi:hypothetical protein
VGCICTVQVGEGMIKEVGCTRASPPYSLTAASLHAGALSGTTMKAGMPRSLAARASAAAWLPELQGLPR